jgi:hypothetical protein
MGPGGPATVDPLGVVYDLAAGGDLLLGQNMRYLDQHATPLIYGYAIGLEDIRALAAPTFQS